MSRMYRSASMAVSALAVCSALGFTAPVSAQEIVADVPLMEFCVSSPVYSCTQPVLGERNVTTLRPTEVTYLPIGTLIEGAANVDFNGELQVAGYATSAVQPFVVPGYTLQYIGEDLTVSGAVNYDVDYSLLYLNSLSDQFYAAPLADGTTFTVNSLAIDTIAVDIVDRYFEMEDGTEGTFSLSSIDAGAIVDNGTAVEGSFYTDEGRIVFGKITGTASVVATTAPTTILADGYVPTDIISPLALSFDVTPVVLTSLDETGLITPTIAVTDGIEMNGSAITGLAAGVAPTDAVNVSQLQAEALARADGDAALQASLDTETAARVAGDAALSTALAAETTARSSADAQIVAALGDEAIVRAEADSALAQGIAANTATLQNVVGLNAAETAARMAADSALAQSIDTLGSRVDMLEGRLDRFEDRIASSAAVATAMSGNAFLPDMTFNLTANVATYDGAQAGSIQMGTLLSPHVALNAGVATGFNKGGKTAGRVGMTIGW